jgi:hypothetical protein
MPVVQVPKMPELKGPLVNVPLPFAVVIVRVLLSSPSE